MSEKSGTQTAYVLVNTEIGKEGDVEKRLRDIENVKEVNLTHGVYDCVTCVEAPNMDSLKEIVTWRISRDKGVASILKMIVVRDEDGKPIGFKRDPKTGKFVYENTPDKIPY